eukprot:300824-Rhodomonas_salina.1
MPSAPSQQNYLVAPSWNLNPNLMASFQITGSPCKGEAGLGVAQRMLCSCMGQHHACAPTELLSFLAPSLLSPREIQAAI